MKVLPRDAYKRIVDRTFEDDGLVEGDHEDDEGNPVRGALVHKDGPGVYSVSSGTIKRIKETSMVNDGRNDIREGQIDAQFKKLAEDMNKKASSVANLALSIFSGSTKAGGGGDDSSSDDEDSDAEEKEEEEEAASSEDEIKPLAMTGVSAQVSGKTPKEAKPKAVAKVKAAATEAAKAVAKKTGAARKPKRISQPQHHVRPAVAKQARLKAMMRTATTMTKTKTKKKTKKQQRTQLKSWKAYRAFIP